MPFPTAQPPVFWLASFPRSGNRFTRSILQSLYATRHLTVYAPISSEGTRSDSARRVAQDHDFSQGLPEGTPPLAPDETVFIKTHELPLPSDPRPALYVLRDGRDSYVSYAHYALRRHPHLFPGLDWAGILESLVKSPHCHQAWSAHVLAWMRRPHPTVLLRYEDLHQDPAAAVAEALRNLGHVPPERPGAVLPLFAHEHQRNPHSARKGQVGGWREEMPPHLEALFWELHGQAMREAGYSR
jgi:hypothetical protein